MVNFNRFVEIGFAIFNPDEHKLRTFHLSGIYFKNRLVSLATNSEKTHSLNKLNPKYGHDGSEILKRCCSEFRAIQRLKKISNIEFHRCVMVNIRINRLGKLANSCPCDSCASLLRHYSFKTVYYTDGNGYFVRY